MMVLEESPYSCTVVEIVIKVLEGSLTATLWKVVIKVLEGHPYNYSVKVCDYGSISNMVKVLSSYYTICIILCLHSYTLPLFRR